MGFLDIASLIQDSNAAMAAKASHPDKLLPGETLAADQKLVSPNKRYELVNQSDGNLVLYDNVPTRHSFWASNTNGIGGHTTMQTDGNLVTTVNNSVGWHSSTMGNPGAFLQLQDDGNAVIYSGSKSLWSTAQSNYDRAGGPGKFIGNVVNAAGSIASAIGSVPGLAEAIGVVVAAIPGVDLVAAGVAGAMASIAAAGQAVSAVSSAVRAASAAASAIGGGTGFNVGIGVMAAPGTTADTITKVRSKLSGNDLKGFDAAMALGVGLKNNPAPKSMTPGQQAGFMLTHGAAIMPNPAMFKFVSNMTISAPPLATGALVAQTQIADRLSWWGRVKQWISHVIHHQSVSG